MFSDGSYSFTDLGGYTPLSDLNTFDFEKVMFNNLPSTFGDSSADTGAEPVSKSDMQELGDILREFSSTDRQRELLRMNLDFEKERMAQAAPYKLAFEIPQALGGAFLKPALMELAGAGKYAQIMDAGIARMPNMVPGAIGLSPIQRNYFQ